MTEARLWAVVPAAGVGKRVGDDVPKQYLRLHHQTILEWSIERLLKIKNLQKIIVAVSESDDYWPELKIDAHPKVEMTEGGFERCYSVLNGLNALHTVALEDDWVLVHDAARPCVQLADLEKLVRICMEHDQGGILAMRVRDTMKQSNSKHEIEKTVARNALWHALTPQMFKFGQLRSALKQALDDGFVVTDEASAMEHAGYHPLLVEGHSDNIKVTVPEDLQLAAHYLKQQESIQNGDDS